MNYQKILNKNLLLVIRDILNSIKDNGLEDGHQLYVTFLTQHKDVNIPDWLKQKYKEEMTIIIQYEYYDLDVKSRSFNISLSFNNILTNIDIPYDSIISIADPFANFGLKFKNDLSPKKLVKKKKKISKKENIIDFAKFKKS